MSTKKVTKKPAKSTAASSKPNKGVLSPEEIAAMKETLRERKAASSKQEEERMALDAITAMKEPDRSMAKRIHAIIKDSAPGLSPKTWYGMPAYANSDGKVVCFFQTGQKFKTRYSTFGFSDSAHLDEGAMWPVSFALKELTAADEARIATLVKKAVS
ncbi:MAG: iron chaperone [Anaerolineae bacterium]